MPPGSIVTVARGTVFAKNSCPSIMVILSDVRMMNGAFQANAVTRSPF